MDETQEKEKLADSITKAIAYAENGGKPDINNPLKGKSGELKSIFQFTEPTWKADAKKFLGNENASLNADNETYVMREKVKKWIDEGRTVSEMASIHNSGQPDSYKKNHVGINKFGVKYDTPSYAKKVVDYSKEFYGNHNSNIDNTNTALTTEKRDMNTEPIDKVMKIIAETKSPQLLSDKNALIPKVTPNETVSKKELSTKLPGLFKGNVTNSGGKEKPSKLK